MKKILLSAALLLSLSNFAQTPIQAFYSASLIPEDDNITHYLLVNSSTPIDQSAMGANMVWNFDNLAVITNTATSVMAPSSTDLANYPGTTMVVETNTEGGNPTYYYLSDTGQGTNIRGAKTSQITLTYTAGGLIGNFPMSANEQVWGSVSGTFEGNGIQGTFSGNAGSSADAYGTLTVNQGFTDTKNVTRLRTDQFLTLKYMGIPVGTLDQTIYSYYSADLVAGPVLRSITTHIVVTSAGIDQTQSTLEVYDQATNGVADHKALAKIVIAPNPVKDVLHFEGNDEIDSVRIIDTAGRVIANGKTNDIQVSQLPAGIYQVLVSSQSGSEVLKMVKQ